MYTYAYELRPWEKAEILGSGDQILNYLAETVDEFGVREKIRFNTEVATADWSSDDRLWSVTARDAASGETRVYRARFLIACTGYYSHDRGHTPDFPGAEQFAGQLIHPQHWRPDVDYADKKVVVIGSGATAVTMVPAMADKAAHITMLQRSPSYFFTLPERDWVFTFFNWFLPSRIAARIARGRSQLLQYVMFKACRRWPKLMRRVLLSHVRRAVSPDIDMRHFSPRYAPWDQRLCVLPEDDLLDALKNGSASVVTDTIDTFTPGGIRLASGEELEADIIVSATGFNLEVFGGMEVSIDGEPVRPGERMIYKGILVEEAPNLAALFGYINFTWTAKVDLAASYLSRLFQHLDATGQEVVVPRRGSASSTGDSIMNRLNSGYVARGADELPRQGNAAPWQVRHDYRHDRHLLLKDPIDDGILEIR